MGKKQLVSKLWEKHYKRVHCQVCILYTKQMNTGRHKGSQLMSRPKQNKVAL